MNLINLAINCTNNKEMLHKASDQQNFISEDLRKLAGRFHGSSRCSVPPRSLLFPAVSAYPLFIVISLNRPLIKHKFSFNAEMITSDVGVSFGSLVL